MTLGEGDTEFAREGKQTPRGPVSHLHVAVGNLYTYLRTWLCSNPHTTLGLWPVTDHTKPPWRGITQTHLADSGDAQ